MQVPRCATSMPWQELETISSAKESSQKLKPKNCLTCKPDLGLVNDSFMTEYGKWIGFPDLTSLLSHLRLHSPLLLSATCLIASRHLPSSSSLDPLVSNLFSESRRLLSLSLLNVPRNVETLQAILILSVWSPLAKRDNPRERPLSGGRTLDSWLLSGYGLMLGMSVIRLNDLTRAVEFKGPRTPVGGHTKENAEGVSQRLRVWNHLCLIHLQYLPQPSFVLT